MQIELVFLNKSNIKSFFIIIIEEYRLTVCLVFFFPNFFLFSSMANSFLFHHLFIFLNYKYLLLIFLPGFHITADTILT